MKYLKCRSITISISILLFLINPAFVLSTTSSKASLTDINTGPIDIRSDSLEIDNKHNVVVFMGNVEATRGDITINCNKIELFYQNIPQDNQNTGKTQARVLEIIATENVRLSRPDGGLATAEKAVYNQIDEQIILTGKPVIKQGSDFVEGSKITLFLKEDSPIS